MKREQFLQELRELARKTGIRLEIIENRGKGSHIRVRYGDRFSTVQSGELDPFHVRRIRKQLGID